MLENHIQQTSNKALTSNIKQNNSTRYLWKWLNRCKTNSQKSTAYLRRFSPGALYNNSTFTRECTEYSISLSHLWLCCKDLQRVVSLPLSRGLTSTAYDGIGIDGFKSTDIYGDVREFCTRVRELCILNSVNVKRSVALGMYLFL